MKTSIRINNTLILITSIISFFSLAFILFQINTNLSEALNINKSKFDILDYLMGSGHLFVLLFNIYAIIIIYSHFHHFEELRGLKIMILILGIISLLSIGAEKVMVDEIARQYRFGMEISEIYILDFAYVINLLFAVVMFYLILRTIPVRKEGNSDRENVDGRIFTIAQYMGILSGFLGLVLVFDLVKKDLPEDELLFYVPFFTLFLIPYTLAVLYWLSLKIRLKVKEWYDEKQLQDVMKASLTTLMLSFPGLLIFLFLDIHSIICFFLYYLFLVLILFSGSILIYYKT